MPKLRVFLLSIVSYLLLTPNAALSSDERGHCTPSEILVFSCVIGAKVASVCASESKTEHGQYLQYRFGRVGKVEMEAPSRNQPKGSGTNVLAYINPIGDGNGYIRFKAGAYAYIVYAFSSRQTQPTNGSAPGWNNWHGVVIERKDKIERVLRCKPFFGVQSNIEPTFLAAHVSHIGTASDGGAVLERVSNAVTGTRSD